MSDIPSCAEQEYQEIVWRDYLTQWEELQMNTMRNWVQYSEEFPGYTNPFLPVIVDPDDIKWVWKMGDSRCQLHVFHGLGQVVGGDWDRHDCRLRIDEHPVTTSIKNRFVNGVEWTDTEYYELARKEIENGGVVQKAFDDVNEFVEERFGFIDELYEAIVEDGYTANTGAAGSENPVLLDDVSHNTEVLVLIDANGEFCVYDGRHRTAITQSIPGMCELPVHVLARHPSWQATRDRVAEMNSEDVPRELLEHPDIQPVM